MSAVLSEIEIPINLTYPHPSMVHPYTTDARLEELRTLLENGGAIPAPIARPVAERYEILKGYEVIALLEAHKRERVRIHSKLYDDDDALNITILEQAESLGLSWLDVAMALHQHKSRLKINSGEVAKQIKLERTRTIRYLKIARELHPQLKQLAKLDRLSFTHCRKLVSLSLAEQAAAAELAHKLGLSGSDLVNRVRPRPTKKVSERGNLKQSSEESKSNDLVQLEILLEQVMGSEVKLTPSSTSEKSGSINYRFIDRADMIEVMSKLRKGFIGKPPIKGYIQIEYNDTDEFNKIAGGFLRQVDND